jgi:hypothetical protein
MKTVYIERNKLFKKISMILLNNITEIDENFVEDNWDLFFTDCGECNGTGEIDDKKCDECYGEGRFDNEYYQYYITDLSELEVECLKSYGVAVGYSEKLEHYIICIGDWGTSWSAFSYSKDVPDDYELESDETLTRTTVY